MRHLDEGILQAWLDGPRGGLSDEERAAVAEHLAECPDCAVVLETLRETTDQAVGLLVPLETPDEEMPDFEAIVARARDIGTRSPSRRRWVAPAWAASIAVALGVGWLGNELSRTTLDPATSNEEVAEAPATETEMAEAAGAEPALTDERRARAERPAPEPETDMVAEADMMAETPSPSAPSQAAPRVRTDSIAHARSDVAEPAPAPMPEPLPGVEQRRTEVAASRGPVTVRGRVTDASSGRPLETAQVFVPQVGAGGLTNADGEFEIALGVLPDSALDDLELRVELIGYTSETRALAAGGRDTRSTEFSSDVQLEGTALRLQELVVTGVDGSAPKVPLPFAFEEARFEELPVASHWLAVSPAEAEAALGFAPRTVPELEVLDLRIATLGGVPVARIVQDLGEGVRLTLLQGPRAFDDPDPETDGIASIRLDEGIFIVGRAPIPSDSIRSLLTRLR